MKKNIKIGAMSLLLVLLPGSLGVGIVYSSSGGNVNVTASLTQKQILQYGSEAIKNYFRG